MKLDGGLICLTSFTAGVGKISDVTLVLVHRSTGHSNLLPRVSTLFEYL